MVTSHFLEEKSELAGSVALPSLSREECVLRMSVTCFEPLSHLSDQLCMIPLVSSLVIFFFQDQK